MYLSPVWGETIVFFVVSAMLFRLLFFAFHNINGIRLHGLCCRDDVLSGDLTVPFFFLRRCQLGAAAELPEIPCNIAAGSIAHTAEGVVNGHHGAVHFLVRNVAAANGFQLCRNGSFGSFQIFGFNAAVHLHERFALVEVCRTVVAKAHLFPHVGEQLGTGCTAEEHRHHFQGIPVGIAGFPAHDHFALVVGDVSGKGVPAALFMVITKTLIKDTAAHEHDPAKIFEHVNNVLCEGNESGLFVTCWLGILTLSTGELKFANAGHNAPLILQNGEIKYLTTKPNLMLAGMDGMPYTTHSTTLAKGDRLFVYTDGVTEATNLQNELYGEDRLLTVMKGATDKTPHEVLDLVRNDINEFVDEAPQFDDITMLEMFFKGQ